MMSKVREKEILIELARIFPVLIVILIITCLFSLGVGQGGVGFGQAIRAIGSMIGLDLSTTEMSVRIVLDVRLPRIVLAALVGMLLASAGVALQAILLNPLADPYTTGVSSGAALGAAVAIVLGGASWLAGIGVPIAAFVTALFTMLIVYSLGRSGGKLSIHSFLLAGIVVGAFLWALLTFILTVAGQDLATVIYWLLGNLSSPDPWGYVKMILPFAILGPGVLLVLSRDLNVFSLGEEGARHLGVDTETLKILVIATASLVTAAAVSASGIIGFVGLIVPHMARRVFGPDHRVILPAAATLGGVLLVLADTASRTVISSGELPVGVVTALIGAPFFCYLLKSR